MSRMQQAKAAAALRRRGLHEDEACAAMGLRKYQYRRLLRLYDLPLAFHQALAEGRVSEGVVWRCSRLTPQQLTRAVLLLMEQGSLSINDVREIQGLTRKQ